MGKIYNLLALKIIAFLVYQYYIHRLYSKGLSHNTNIFPSKNLTTGSILGHAGKKTINTHLKLEICVVCKEVLAFKHVVIVFF